MAPTGEAFTKVATGRSHTYALDSTGMLTATSYAGHVDREAPEGTFIDIDTEDLACGIRTDGSPLCWEPDDPAAAEEDYLTLEAPTGVYEQVCLATENIACALDVDGVVQCWGASESINAVPTGYEYLQVACGYHRVCALTTDGQIVCWGVDGAGETVPPT